MNAVFENLLNNIPDYKEFLTLEELDASSKALAEKYPAEYNVVGQIGTYYVCWNINEPLLPVE